MHRFGFLAMGTDVDVLLDASPGPAANAALADVEREFGRLEQIFSRFLPDSELSRLNEAGELDASEEMREVVALALAARERTAGRFDPTVHDALVAAGYDRTFDDIDGHGGAPAPAGGGVRVTGRRIELDEGVRLDLGGIAKGYAVDRTLRTLAPCGPCLVNAGGDLAVSGLPDAGVWPVGVDTPSGPLTLGVKQGALATSGRDRRRWRTDDGEERHHLIDPATGRPAGSDLFTVTVAASTAVEAEVAAKALFLAGETAAAAEADAQGIPALLVTEDGRLRFAGGLS
jgi:thiamine biosynthesis lipoprotein